MYKVFIPTSGIGSRLGDITKYTNKSLVKIGKKPTLSYIIEKYPKEIEFVITLGYFGDHVKQFLTMAYPDRKFTFVKVDKYEGEGTSLGFSMLHAKESLQCPFIYNACDTITFDDIVEPDHDWIGGYNTDNLSQYDSYNVSYDSSINSMFQKGEIGSDFAYIGLIGVNDYETFWETMDTLYNENPNNHSLSDFWCINRILNTKNNKVIKHKEFKKWYDIGNVEALMKARDEFSDSFHILDKVKESIYLFEDSVIKFFADEQLAKNRVDRSYVLDGITPKMIDSSKNFYKYEYVHGDLLADVINPSIIENLLNWSKDNLWHSVEYGGDFNELCESFYLHKTNSRINDYLSGNDDDSQIINGEKVPSINDLLSKIDFSIFNSEPTRYHGDFIADNILKTEEGFCLLDWRQDFAGDINVGDVYYDLAKMNHNLVINHDIVNNDLYNIEKTDELVIDIHRRNLLIECQERLHKWIEDNGYDLFKVKLLTCIIWLNMSPLHHKPFDKFLFYFGKYNLNKLLNG